MFVQISIQEQNMLGTEEGVNKFLGLIVEDDLRGEVKVVLDQYITSLQKWEAFIKFYNTQKQLVKININLNSTSFYTLFFNLWFDEK